MIPTPIPIANFANTNFANTSCAVHPMEPCSYHLSGRTLENLSNLLANCQKQIGIYQKMIGDVAARGSDTIPADRSIQLPISYIAELNAANRRLLETVNSAVHDANNRYTHIVQQQEKAAEAERKAKESPLKFIAEGNKSTVYEIPESFGRLVLKVGPLAAIDRERLNIVRLSQAYRMHHAIWHDLGKGWLIPFLVPHVGGAPPAGWVRDVSTGLLKPSENLDPRIPGFYDAMGDRISVDSDEQVGIVLSRIGDLKGMDRRTILWMSYEMEDAKLQVLDENDHFLIRIYLGRKPDGDTVDHAASDDQPLSTLNLPGYLDHIIKACGESKKAERRVLSTCAREIAFGYALLHWGARLDGRGIEFLLGASPSGFGMRLYMLDYEDCRPISDMTVDFVRDQLVPAALENDPYIPRPTVDRRHMHQLQEGYGESLWLYGVTTLEAYVFRAFVMHYLEASDKIWAASAHDFDPVLPMLFIHEFMGASFGNDTETNADAHANQYVASEDGNDDDAESAQDASGSQEAPEHFGHNQSDQSQDDLELYDNEQHGDNGNGPDPTDTDDSSEGEEDSDEDDDDDYDDVD